MWGLEFQVDVGSNLWASYFIASKPQLFTLISKDNNGIHLTRLL